MLASHCGEAAHADLLDIAAQDYNVLTFGNYTQAAVDVTGRLAVGGDLTVSNFAVGMALTGAPTGTSLIVGGNLDWRSGSVFAGDIRVGGAASVLNFGSDAGTSFY